jgi:hypothetical protein
MLAEEGGTVRENDWQKPMSQSAKLFFDDVADPEVLEPQNLLNRKNSVGVLCRAAGAL